MKQHIPNLITLLNLFSGCIAVVMATLNTLELAAFFVLLGIFFDFFDGLAARLLNVKSDFGLQLDSLADMVTSGVAPGIVMFQLLNRSYAEMSVTSPYTLSIFEGIPLVHTEIYPMAFFGFVITLASAWRLAKFNLDENQVSSFVGLPTPANTLLIFSLPLMLIYQGSDLLNTIILNPWFLLGMTVLSAYLLNAKIALFALKFEHWSFKGNEVKYFFLVLSILAVVFFRFAAVPVILALYFVMSLLGKNV